MTMNHANTVLAVSEASVDAWGARLLDQLSLTVQAGEVIAVIGPNGAGKTTLLRAINNDIALASGGITIDGRRSSEWGLQERAKSVAVLPQASLLNFPFTVEEVVGLARTPHSTGVSVDAAIVRDALKLMDIAHLSGRQYPRLSGGEKQRVQLARVMAQIWRAEDAVSPGRLLLLDEPTTALDLGHQQQLMQAIRRFADEGVAVLMISHDFSLCSHYADRLLALCCGERVAYGSADEVITSRVIKQLFNIEPQIIRHPDTHKPVVLL